MFNDIIRVTKEFTFDMAHALFGYDGPCKNIHGHTYRLAVTVIGKVNEDAQDPKLGMVIDFSNLKDLVKAEIIEVFDHALVLNTVVPEEYKSFINNTTDKVMFVPYQPTCENLLLDMKNKLEAALNTKQYQLFHVKLCETPTSFAEWYRTDNA